jgi:hypothetical protein
MKKTRAACAKVCKSLTPNRIERPSCQSPHDELDAGDHDPCGGCGDQRLEVFGEAAVPVELCNGSLHHPAAREQDEALGGVGALDDVDCPGAERSEGCAELVPGLAAVGDDVAEPRTRRADRVQQGRAAVAVLNVGLVDEDGDRQAGGIGQEMAHRSRGFHDRSLDLLAGIIAARSAASRACIIRCWLIVCQVPS